MGAITAKDVLDELVRAGCAQAQNMKEDETFLDAGVDSFDVMKIVDVAPEKFGVEVQATELFQWGSPVKVAEAMNERKAGGTPAVDAPKTEAPKAPESKPGAEVKPAEPASPTTVKASPSPAAATKKETVHELFERLKLSSDYADAWEEDGYDDPEFIRSLDDDEFLELCTETAKMKKGHLSKMKLWKEGKL
jgi:acyl carrier protein